MVVLRLEVWPWGAASLRREICRVTMRPHADGGYEVAFIPSRTGRVFPIGMIRGDKTKHLIHLAHLGAQAVSDWLLKYSDRDDVDNHE